MITVEVNSPDDCTFEVFVHEPRVYLDHWAIRRISETPSLSDRFFAAFSSRGTLLFSLMNVAEIGRDADADRAAEIRWFLERVGPHWNPMTIDPIRIRDVEDTGILPNNVHPCISESFLQDEEFRRQLKSGPVSLVHVVDLTRGSAGDKIRVSTDASTSKLRAHIDALRLQYRCDPAILDIAYPQITFTERTRMRYIYQSLIRAVVRQAFPFTDNHARDLFHTACSIRCAWLVTLDGHWAEQVRQLRLPVDYVHVYDEPRLNDFLVKLESYPVVR